ncbi:MAG TPA: sugar ABC transporter permease [Gemmatimonadales bacterium]|nr:sugar ABC transporter permease [Gemmatimonadales bacterium]
MKRVTLFRWAGGVAAVGTALSAYVATTGSRRFAERRYAERTAASAAAYLTAQTPKNAPVDPGAFLRRARVLATLPDWSPDVEVYLGTAPLVHPTGPTIPLSTIALLSSRRAPEWSAGAAFAPVTGPFEGRVVGVVRVRPHLPEDASSSWLLGLLGLTAVLGALAAVQLRRRYWAWWLGAYAASALAFGGVAASTAHATLRTATVRWLRETAILIEDAGSRLPRTPTPALVETFKALAADGTLGPDTSSDPVLERALAGTRPGAPLPIWLGGGRWLSLQPPAEDWQVTVRHAVAGTAAVAGAVLLIMLSWGAGDRAHPGRIEETLSAWMFLAPAGAHLAALTVAPLGVLIYVAVHQWDLTTGAGAFVGLANLADVVSRSDTWAVLARTGLFALHVPVAAAIALVLALAVRRAPSPLIRVLLVAPPFASVAAAGLIWKNGLASWGWFDQPEPAFVALFAIAIVLQIGYQVPAFLAGLDRIPRALSDAAALDGAGAWSRFRRVTEPLLRPVTLTVLVTGVAVAVQGFTLAFVAGAKAPVLASLDLYQLGWRQGRIDLAAALAVLLGALFATVAVFQIRIWGRGVTHEA